MNYIQPFLRPINFTECIKYTQKYKSLRRRYENFKIEMLGKNKSIDEINYIWNENYGKIPPEQPIRFYHCKISNDNITMLVTVKENVDYFNNNELQFEVVKLNKLILTKFDKDNICYSSSDDIINQNKTLFNLYIQSDTENIKTTSKVEIDKEALNFSQLYGQVIDKEDFFILNKEETSTYSLYNSITLADELAIDLNNVTIALEDRLSTATKATTSTADIENNDFILNQPKEEIIKNKFLILKYPYNNPNENMAVNYEDSNWFGILSIRKFLESLKIKVTPYIINGVEIIPVPKAFIYSLDYIEILDFDFYDDEFKNNLYKEINKAFIKNLL